MRWPTGPARAARVVALLGSLMSCLAACATGGTASRPSTPPFAPQTSAPPDLRPGDRWVYEWTSGTDSGTKAVEIVEIKTVNRVRYYVVRVGDLDHYYTTDLQWAGSVRDSKVEARMVPPQPWFVWPLDVGRRWDHRGIYEEAGAKHEQGDSFAVVAAEAVEVPAGRFQAVKIVRESNRRESDQYWYAPEIGWYARWIGRRGDVEFEERLREYQFGPRLIPGPAGPPGKTN